ncbi:MAG: L-lactate dehydrogenase [Polyangiaceae bacterium]|nr:L-lactate dehydrogenase [Polyangiaceae bacterium]
MKPKIHVTILGAGAVGVSSAVSILHNRICARLSLYDLVADKARGEALDLAHGAPLLGGVTVDGGGLDEVEGGDVCIVTAGAKQRPGEDRLALLARNERALDDIARVWEARGMPRVVVVVTNPVDVMTEALRRRLQGTNVSVFGSGTLLDTLRLRHALSRMLDLAPDSIHASVVGEHGDSSVCLLDSGRAGGRTLEAALGAKGIALDEAFRQSIAEQVRGAAYQIIARKGATSHAIGVAVARITRAVVGDERAVLPVSAPVEPGVCAGTPCILGSTGATPLGLDSFPLSPRERDDVARSVDVLRARCAELSA